jgi:hypothetical protein
MKRKRPHANLQAAMDANAKRPRILYSQGRAERADHGARRAAIGGSFDASTPVVSQGVDNADGPSTPGSDSGSVKPGR